MGNKNDEKKYVTVIMKENKPGSPDGIHTFLYKKGEQYDLPEKLANVFIDTLNVAEKVNKTIPKKKEEYDPDLNLGLGKKTAVPDYNKKVMGEKEKGKK